MLQAAGLKEIEVTSFVSPKWVPQMADNVAVMAAIERQPGVRYAVLTPNMKGLGSRRLPTRPDEIVVFAAASPRPSARRTSTARIAESIERFAPGGGGGASVAGIKVRGALSCAVGLPLRGRHQRRSGRARGAV